MELPVLVSGALIVAGCAAWLARRRSTMASSVADVPPGTDVINVSSVKVAGVGGLGLVAMAITVALNVPRIGYSLGIGLALGILFAVALIVRARRTGPLPSSGKGLGATTVLSLRESDQTDAARPTSGHIDRAASPCAVRTPAPVIPR